MKSEKLNPTDIIRRRYDRMAFFFGWMDKPRKDARPDPWRQKLQEKMSGQRILEVGMGTGKNLPYYPAGRNMSAIDFSPKMLDRAKAAAKRMNLSVSFQQMDVQQLDFPDATFDTVFATFVFCSVPDPVQGLREQRRVCKPGGRLLLLEHMRPDNFCLGKLFDAVNPLTLRIAGANINRRTDENIRKAGWQIEVEEHLFLDVVRWFEAVSPQS